VNKAVQSALSLFKQKDNELYIAGKPISEIMRNQIAPAYIYDSSILKLKHEILRRIIPDEIDIYYAVKANPYVPLLKLIGSLYDGLDIASMGEMQKALNAGIPAQKMSFAGPGKSMEELEFAISKEIGSISVENEGELENIQAITTRKNKIARILLRVNPDFDLTGSGMKMGGGPKQFGIDSEKLPEVIDRVKTFQLINFVGIHIYAGSQILDAASILESFGKIFEYAKNLKEHSGVNLPKINLGGGFGIPYFANDEPLDIERIGSGLRDMLIQYKKYFPETRFNIELGRYIIGECGLYVSKILYRKISRGQIFLIINGGMHHHLAASGNFGQSLVRRPFPVIIANKLTHPLEKVNVVGPLCTPLDTFGSGIELQEAGEGDLIAVLNSGAYGFSASPLGFLSHREPSEIII